MPASQTLWGVHAAVCLAHLALRVVHRGTCLAQMLALAPAARHAACRLIRPPLAPNPALAHLCPLLARMLWTGGSWRDWAANFRQRAPSLRVSPAACWSVCLWRLPVACPRAGRACACRAVPLLLCQPHAAPVPRARTRTRGRQEQLRRANEAEEAGADIEVGGQGAREAAGRRSQVSLDMEQPLLDDSHMQVWCVVRGCVGCQFPCQFLVWCVVFWLWRACAGGKRTAGEAHVSVAREALVLWLGGAGVLVSCPRACVGRVGGRVLALWPLSCVYMQVFKRADPRSVVRVGREKYS